MRKVLSLIAMIITFSILLMACKSHALCPAYAGAKPLIQAQEAS